MAGWTLNSMLLQSDKYTYEYFLQGDVCRFCWSPNSFTEIASVLVQLGGIKVDMIEAIKDCLDVDVFDDKYPNKLCEQCWDIIKKFYSFKSYCKQSDIKLRDIIDSGLAVPKAFIPTNSITNVQSVIKEECTTNSDVESTPVLPTVNIKVRKRRLKPVKQKPKSIRTPTYCYKCCTDFETDETLKKHNLEYHGINNGLYKCFSCDNQSPSSRLRSRHEMQCEALKLGYKCGLCDRYLPIRKQYDAHMRYHAGKQNDIVELTDCIFKCKKCEESFKTKDNLIKHMATHVSKPKRFVCEKCGRIFRRQDYLRKHSMIHTGNKQYKCNYCGLRFIQKSALSVHLRKHTGERPYKCDLCDQRCVSNSNLHAHRKRHLGTKQFECAICGKKFGYKISLAEHITSAHAPSSETHQCELCGAIYTRLKSLQRHVTKKHGDGSVARQDGINLPSDNNLEVLVNNL